MTDYVKFFRDTSPYINMHRGKTFVLALPGEGIRNDNFGHIIHDIALLSNLGIKIVLVHGAKPQVDKKLAQGNVIPRFAPLHDSQSQATFEKDTRITDSGTMSCVKEAVGGTTIAIEALLSMDLPNSPMQGARLRVISGNFITAKPLGIRAGIDFHHSGEVRRIDRAGIKRQLEDGAIVLLSPLGYSPTGEAFNLTCEDVATQTAITLEAEKLIYFCRERGILDDQDALVKTIDMVDVRPWLRQLNEQVQLRDALQAGYDACLHGVPRSHLISYAEDGALLRELFTREGAGTLLSHHGGETIRQATIDDVGGVLELITPLEDSGILVKRSRELLETEISRFQVMVHPEGMIIACAALHPFPDTDSGELACVVSHPDFHKRGLAARLLKSIEQKARDEYQLNKLFVLTTQADHWFQEQGFKASSLDELPTEKAALYNLQRNSKILVKTL
ncbi:MAG: amino-acid N-acetyltransferase [Gammaproteobacteria bacterium]|nr:MAG: amino-acid N-acetyltransferase [Gammaproteobacteria bacterium]